MDEVMSEDELSMEVAIPAPEHIETILDGVSDSLDQVAGTESLTNAQVYLGSVLAANGYIRKNQVGQEGFLAKAGEGFKAAVAYVKKMFTNLWDFFFKRDAPKLVAEAKEEVKAAEDALKVIESGGSNEKETTEALTNMRKVILALSHEPDTNKSALDQILKEADEAMKGDQAKKKAAVLMIGRELPKLNKRSTTAMKKRVDDMVRVLVATEKAVDAVIDKGEGVNAASIERVYGAKLKSEKGEIAGVLAKFQKASSETTPANLKDCYTYTSQSIEAASRAHTSLKEGETSIKAEIAKLEAGEESTLKSSVQDLKRLLSSVTSLAQVTKELLGSSRQLLKTGNKAFGY
jgi:hypothetical protein